MSGTLNPKSRVQGPGSQAVFKDCNVCTGFGDACMNKPGQLARNGLLDLKILRIHPCLGSQKGSSHAAKGVGL